MSQRFKPCAADGCQRNAHRDASGKRGWCSLHYTRVRKHGDPNVTKTAPSPAQDWMAAHASYQGDECLRWPFAIGRDGYGRAHEPGSGKLMTASRLMCVIAHGVPPSRKHEAAHSCGKGNAGCVNPRHLYWATSSQNHGDKVAHGTSNRGERQGRAKLTETDVRAIRSLIGTMTQAAIAKMYSVDQSLISDIKRGVVWGWLP